MPARKPPVDPAEFRRLMARWATGVTVVTTRDGDVDAGLTVNAFLSVALEPPTVLVSLTLAADSTPLLERSRTFAVNLLAADQRAVSERFARTIPPAEKFRDLAVHRGATGAPLLDGTLGNLECRIVEWLPRRDHVLILGEVVRQEVGRDAEPLLFYRAGYGTAEGADRVRLPPAGPR